MSIKILCSYPRISSRTSSTLATNWPRPRHYGTLGVLCMYTVLLDPDTVHQLAAIYAVHVRLLLSEMKMKSASKVTSPENCSQPSSSNLIGQFLLHSQSLWRPIKRC